MIKKIFINMLCAFVPSKKLRKKIRSMFLNNGSNDCLKFTVSNAQFGEDIIVASILSYFFQKSSTSITYLEIGSNNPVETNNTYYFYRRNGSGVLVEPNPNFAKITTQLRPGDIFLNCGIAFDDKKESTYYDFGQNAHALNTFSQERAESVSKHYNLVRKINLPLMDINEIFSKYFSDRELDFMSIDVEGLDLEILKKINYNSKIRAKIICVEANMRNITYGSANDIIQFMEENDYALVASTFVNLIFADTKQMKPTIENIVFKNRKIS